MPQRLFLITTTAVLAALLLLPAPAAAQYVAGSDFAFVDRPTTLARSGASDTLVVTYRPNSSIARVDTLVGAREWTPRQAGVVKLQAPGGEAQSVSVRFDRTPVSGLFVLIGAGLILFGGAGFAFRKLLEDDDLPVA